jgi:hypothetical protein
MEAEIPALSELQDIILKTCLLIHNEKVGFLSDSRINFKKELIVDEGFDGIVIVISPEISIYEREAEHFIFEKIIDFLWCFACDSWCNANSIAISGVLTPPEFQFNVVHYIPVKVSEDLVIKTLHTCEIVDSVTLDFVLISKPKLLIPTLCKF